jgi:hypothetical protein
MFKGSLSKQEVPWLTARGKWNFQGHKRKTAFGMQTGRSGYTSFKEPSSNIVFVPHAYDLLDDTCEYSFGPLQSLERCRLK